MGFYRVKEGGVMADSREMTLRLRVYEFLATPAHLWLWCCGRLMGWRFECGPVDDSGKLYRQDHPD